MSNEYPISLYPISIFHNTSLRSRRFLRTLVPQQRPRRAAVHARGALRRGERRERRCGAGRCSGPGDRRPVMRLEKRLMGSIDILKKYISIYLSIYLFIYIYKYIYIYIYI